MTGEWTADVANDPSNDYSLCIEIALDGEHRASIVRNDSGQLVLRWYADEADMDVPVKWLLDILQRANREL